MVKPKTSINGHVPSLMLCWEMPSNIKTAQEIQSYKVRFRPYLSQQYKELPPIDRHCRDITLGREQLKPLTTYDFEVKAVSSDGAGPWTAVTKHFCKHTVCSQSAV